MDKTNRKNVSRQNSEPTELVFAYVGSQGFYFRNPHSPGDVYLYDPEENADSEKVGTEVEELFDGQRISFIVRLFYFGFSVERMYLQAFYGKSQSVFYVEGFNRVLDYVFETDAEDDSTIN